MARLALLIATLPLCALASTDAGVLPPLQVSARAVPDKVKLGEPFTVEVVVTHPGDQRYDLTPTDDPGAFDVLGVERKRLDGADSATTTFLVKMSGFELGQKKTPDLKFAVAAPEASGVFGLPGVDVEVVGTIPAEAAKTGAGLFDVRPPEEVAVRTWRLLYALGIAVAVGLLAWGLMRYLARPRPVAAVAPRPTEPLDVRTRTALDALRAEDLPGKSRGREFYFRLSEILRTYLGERYSFDALESTTPELLSTLRTLHTPGLSLSELASFANESDFVRYAKATPTLEGCKQALEFSYQLVTSTTAAAAPAAPERTGA